MAKSRLEYPDRSEGNRDLESFGSSPGALSRQDAAELGDAVESVRWSLPYSRGAGGFTLASRSSVSSSPLVGVVWLSRPRRLAGWDETFAPAQRVCVGQAAAGLGASSPFAPLWSPGRQLVCPTAGDEASVSNPMFYSYRGFRPSRPVSGRRGREAAHRGAPRSRRAGRRAPGPGLAAREPTTPGAAGCRQRSGPSPGGASSKGRGWALWAADGDHCHGRRVANVGRTGRGGAERGRAPRGAASRSTPLAAARSGARPLHRVPRPGH
jgi:hypothetical protein